MQTFKTIVVVGTLLCVGYGAHVIMNKPISNQPLDIGDNVWDDLQVQTPDMQPPDVDLTATDVNELVPDLPQMDSGPPMGIDAVPQSLASETVPPTNLNAPPMDAAAAAQVATVTQTTPLNPLPQPTQPATTVPVDQTTPQPVVAVNPMEESFTAPSAPPELNAPPTNQTATTMAPEYSSTWSNGFEEMWDSVQIKLQSSQYVDALLALSLFYNDQELTGEQRERMISLLDQLAGTVIYSNDYHMESAYVVQQPEALASVAAKYNVPEMLLARINGLETGQLSPGTQVKVLRGPFRGELDVSGRELTVFLGRYYAGRFSVGVGRDLPADTATLEVADKGGSKAFVDRRTGQEVAAGAPDNPYGAYWIGLRDPNMPEYTFLGIHSMGASIDASDTRGCISVSDQDASDLQAILSAGSKIALVR